MSSIPVVKMIKGIETTANALKERGKKERTSTREMSILNQESLMHNKGQKRKNPMNEGELELV